MDIYKKTMEISNKLIEKDLGDGKVPAELIPAIKKEMKKDEDTRSLLIAARNAKKNSEYPNHISMVTRAMLGRSY